MPTYPSGADQDFLSSSTLSYIDYPLQANYLPLCSRNFLTQTMPGLS